VFEIMSESAEIRDPVCGKTVDPLRARAVGIYGGVTHYFCSPECKAGFVDPRQPEKADAPPPGGVERRWKDEEPEPTGEWFEKGLASSAPLPVTAPVERFTDLEPAATPMKAQPPSPSLLIELEGAKKKSPWPWVLAVLALGGAALWFFGLRG
jgi:YHS domain-containing protein